MTVKDVDLADLVEPDPIADAARARAATAGLIFSPPVSWPDDLDLRATAATRLETLEQYTFVATLWTALKERIDEIRGFFAPRKGAAHGVWQQWLSDEHEAIDRYVAAELKAAALLGQYDQRQRLKAAEEQRRLIIEARAQAEAAQLQAALHADADGESDLAADFLDTPAMLAPIETVVSHTPVVEGVGMTSRWKAEVVDLNQLICAAADEIRGKHARIAASMLKADPVVINKTATAMKGNLAQIAGRLGLTVWDDRKPRRT